MIAAGVLARSLVTSVHTDAQTVNSYDAARDKQHVINLLAAGGLHEQAVDCARCCAEFRALGCERGHIFNPVPTYRCRYRLCLECAKERQRRAYGRLYPILSGYQRAYRHDRPCLITLTVKSSFEPLSVHDRRFKLWFKRLRRSKRWKHCIRAAVAGFEFTFSAETGWHYHVHILAFRKVWYEQAEIAAQWEKITQGAGQIVDIQSKGTLRTMTDEVLKYCFKPADLTKWGVPQILEFNAMRGVRLGECYGELRGMKLDDERDLDGEQETEREHDGLFVGAPCPCCGEPLQVVTISRSEVRNDSS